MRMRVAYYAIKSVSARGWVRRRDLDTTKIIVKSLKVDGGLKGIFEIREWPRLQNNHFFIPIRKRDPCGPSRVKRTSLAFEANIIPWQEPITPTLPTYFQ